MKAFALALLTLAAACDESQALHEPHPSLERMQTQQRVDPFSSHEMLTPPHDTVAREDESELPGDDVLIPVVDASLLAEGRDHFDRICAACHGVLGDGHSVVATKMTAHPPTSLVEGDGATSTTQQIYEVVRDGKGWMPAFAHELSTRERWATAFYLLALRLSRHAVVAELPPSVQIELRENASR